MDKLLKMFNSHPRLKDGVLCFLSAGLLILAFPKTDLGWMVWIGLVPLMFALDGKKPWAAFRSGYFCGVLFFAGGLCWFFHVARWFSYIAVIGVLLLFLYLALYFGLFALGYSFFSRRRPLPKLFLLPSVWVILEFIRAHLFTGFDWASLGHSQYKNLPLIQIADVTGVFGVSFVIVMVNVFLKEWFTARFAVRRASGSGKSLVSSALAVVLAGIFILGYGTYRLWLPAGQQPSPYLSPLRKVYRLLGAYVFPSINLEENITMPASSNLFLRKAGSENRLFFPLSVRGKQIGLCSTKFLREHNRRKLSPQAIFSVAIIQANIPQELKWEESAGPVIMEKYKILTEQAARENPDLIVWPETSYPHYLWEEDEVFNQIKELVRRLGVPLLFGSVIKEGEKYYNAAILLSEDGEVAQVYRKAHLVPFGEFLPLRRVLPFLSELVGIGDFTAGHEWTIFPGRNHSFFSALICFEDTVSRLSRHFVRNGSQLLINMTNDAWFGDSRAPFMHLQSSVFRAVENRRSLVRAANTGVSCFIDQRGKIYQCVEKDVDSQVRRTYISGYAKAAVELNQTQTFYTKFGDIFTIICFGCILWEISKAKLNIHDLWLT